VISAIDCVTTPRKQVVADLDQPRRVAVADIGHMPARWPAAAAPPGCRSLRGPTPPG
jgi:hypothetical protein